MEMPPRLTPSRLTKLSLFFILLYTLHVLRSCYLFESYLNSSQISYADFPLSYQIALNESLATKTPLVYDNSLLPTKSEDETIAPTIHFIWFRDLYPEQLHRADHSSKIPHEGSDAADSCRKNSPDFSVKVWNSSSVLELLTSSYPSFLPTYLSYPHPIQRIDAAKYFIIYHHGGVYMDMDISCRRPLTPLLTFSSAWFPKATLWGVNNDLFAAKKGHPLLRRMIDGLEGRNWDLGFPYLTIYWSTGPQFTSDMLKGWWAAGKGNADGVRILPAEIYSGDSPYFGHRVGGTWHGSDVAFVLWLIDHPIILIIFALSSMTPSILLCIRARQRQRQRRKRRSVKTEKL